MTTRTLTLTLTVVRNLSLATRIKFYVLVAIARFVTTSLIRDGVLSSSHVDITKNGDGQ